MLELYKQYEYKDCVVMLNKQINENNQEDLEQLGKILSVHHEMILSVTFKDEQLIDNKLNYFHRVKYLKEVK